MRWQYRPENESDEEVRLRHEKLADIARFWEAWHLEDGALARALLSAVDDRLLLEKLEPSAVPGGLGFALTSFDPETRPLRRAILEAAPQGLTLPSIARPRFRPSTDPVPEVLGALDLAQTRIQVGIGRGHLLEIVIDPALLPGRQSLKVRGRHPDNLSLCELAVETLLGEEHYSRWLGSVSLERLVRAGPLRVLGSSGPASQPGTLLVELFDRGVAGILDGLSNELYCGRNEGEWTLFELEPELPVGAADFAAQDDVVLVASAYPELLKAFLGWRSFFSGRFSKNGELFCYVKYESRATDWQARIAERDRLERALGSALRQAGLGAVIGTGYGMRYSYVDVALSNVGDAVGLLRAVANDQKLGDRAWLLFFDVELAEEWIGLGHSTEAPLTPTYRVQQDA